MALMWLSARVARARGHKLHIVTVNHHLRGAEAVAEIQMVAQNTAQLGLKHTVLDWRHGGQIAGNVMGAARRARYALLESWAHAHSIAHIAVAHTADDQAECVLMGLGRAAGLDGVCGMHPAWHCGDLRFFRPLLEITRADLRLYLRSLGASWAEDSSNDDLRFQRIQARAALPHLAPLGITPRTLARVARNLAAAQNALEYACDHAAAQVFTQRAGALFVDIPEISKLPDELARRLVQRAVLWFSGAPYPPRAAKLARFTTALREGRTGTLCGCRIIRWRGQSLLLREARAIANNGAAIAFETDRFWDHRWQISGKAAAPKMSIGALGPQGLARLPHWRALDLPRPALEVTPALWQGDRLICAPTAGFCEGWRAIITSITHSSS